MSTMPELEEKVVALAGSIGIQAAFEGPADFRQSLITHGGVPMWLILQAPSPQDLFVQVAVVVGYLPKGIVAPVLRRLLELNAKTIGPMFALTEADQQLQLKYMRPGEGLDALELKAIIDGVAGLYRSWVLDVVREFQIPQRKQ